MYPRAGQKNLLNSLKCNIDENIESKRLQKLKLNEKNLTRIILTQARVIEHIFNSTVKRFFLAVCLYKLTSTST